MLSLLPERLGQTLRHCPAVLDHVADAAGRAAVVLQHVVLPGAVADEVRAADVDVDVARDVHAEHLAAAFNIKTIGDLGKNKFFRAATLISQLHDAGAK